MIAEAVVQGRRPRVAFISTRAIDEESAAGRIHIARAIRTSLEGWSDLSVHRLPSVLTDPSFGRTFDAGLAAVWSLFRQPVLPLQCAIFAAPRDVERLIDRLPPDLNAVYLDGVRSYAFMAALRRRRPDLRIINDLDDLMSRRMDLLLEVDEYLSPGYFTRHLPGPLRRLLTLKPVGKLIVLFERATLRQIERRICNLGDAVVLLSAADAQVLEGFTGGRRAEIVQIPPPSQPAVTRRPFTEAMRFVFVGSDSLTQNRLTIDYLIDLWRRYKIETPLVLFGLRGRELSLPPTVLAAGYVERIEDIYDGRSVLVTPSLLGGGIKTKVLEAFAYGAPVIGNTLTFESIPIGDYPLRIDDEAGLVALLRNPKAHKAPFDKAVAHGMDYIARSHDLETFTNRWRRLMVPEECE
jgi:glycosyltransferase involved in cell wall biosynthesis